MRRRLLAAHSALVLTVAAAGAWGQLTVVPTGSLPVSHVGNLVTNGSFEYRNAALQPGPGNFGGQVFWATGTTATPFAVPYAWTSTGGASTYAGWGGNLGSPVTHHGSAPLADGFNALYFGN